MNRYIAAVLGAGFAWGFMGLFTRILADAGIGPAGSVAIRCGTGALCFLLFLLAKNVNQLRIQVRDLWCFVGTGVVSLLFFTYCYFNAIELMSLSAAAILLYTAPMIVVVLSAIFFRERITRPKVIAMVLAFAGCALVSGVTGGVALTPTGLLFGLGAGFGYALYTIFSRFALQRGYSPTTINFYSCLFAASGAFLIWRPADAVSIMFSSASVFAWCVGLGVITCFVAYALYTYALTGLENGRAAVVCSIEPVVASVLGVVVFHEVMTVPMLAGVTLVLLAIAVLNSNPQSATDKRRLRGLARN